MALPFCLSTIFFSYLRRPEAKGDEVVTQGGVIGKISKLGETFVSVEVASGVELQVQRAAIVQVLPKGTYK